MAPSICLGGASAVRMLPMSNMEIRALEIMLECVWDSLELLHRKVDRLMVGVSDLDAALTNLGGEVDAVATAMQAIIAKASSVGIDVSAEVATINSFHDKLAAVVSAAANVVATPVNPVPPANPPIPPVTTQPVSPVTGTVDPTTGV